MPRTGTPKPSTDNRPPFTSAAASLPTATTAGPRPICAAGRLQTGSIWSRLPTSSTNCRVAPATVSSPPRPTPPTQSSSSSQARPRLPANPRRPPATPRPRPDDRRALSTPAHCPLVAPDLCHFAVRLPRTELHRLTKHGTRNYEDEKFTYLVATRAPNHAAESRIITRPSRPKGQVVLDLCTSDGNRCQQTIPKSSDRYRPARSATWGETW